ncbi:MAG: hypothetical protein KAW17_12445 [Candidatus Eisenbacteria sp.]|nr:hypothetical protein [Candidatus Eisenbacteria bacterium]
MRKMLLGFVAIVFLAVPVSSYAGLVTDYFGVTLSTGSVGLGDETFEDVFTHDWTPSQHIGTTDFVVDDWYGKESLSFDPYITLFGSVPSGGEPYDVEAIYLDNDGEFLYVSIVTSFPPEGFTHPEIPDIHVPPGDITIGINGGLYDFGIDVDGGTGIIHATTPSDWYVWNETYSVPAQGELTHFDGGVALGPVALSYTSAELTENECDTFLIEAVIPLVFLGDPPDGTQLYVHWVCGCRNDASGSNPILKLEGDIDRDPLATQMTTWGGVKAQFR